MINLYYLALFTHHHSKHLKMFIVIHPYRKSSNTPLLLSYQQSVTHTSLTAALLKNVSHTAFTSDLSTGSRATV